MQRIKAFISYSSSDCNQKAGSLKEIFQKYLGFDSFIAHSDIPVGRNFNEMIINQIKISHVFIPLISTDSEKSTFVNQEIGIAMGSGRPIVPIKINNNPGGFISHIQAMQFPIVEYGENSTIINSHFASKILFALYKDAHLSSLRTVLFESLLFAFSNSSSYYSANIVGHYVA